MPGRVLVVEDSTLLAHLLKDALRAQSVADEVYAFGTGAQMLEAYQNATKRNETVSLLVIDIELPGPSGILVARACRAHERQVGLRPAPIVFFSGRAEDDEIRAAVADCFPCRYARKGGSGGPAHVVVEGVKLMRSLLSGG